MPDYTTDAPDMSPDAATGVVTPEQLQAYAAWQAAHDKNMPDNGMAPQVQGVPHFIRDGLRMFVRLEIAKSKFYLRHKPTIDPYLPPEAVVAATALANLLATLETLDQAGPN